MKYGCELLQSCGAVVLISSEVVPDPLIVGEPKVQVASRGIDPQLRLTGPEKPLTEVTVTASWPVVPTATRSGVGPTVSWNEGMPGAVMVSANEPDFEGRKFWLPP